MEKIIDLALTGKVGFQADEVMTGTHHFEDLGNYGQPKEDLTMEFRVSWGPKDMVKFIKDLFTGKPAIAELKGVVDIGGLCQFSPVRGTLELRYFVDATLQYDFFFSSVGRDFHFIGRKTNLRLWNLHRTHTTCYGELYWIGGPDSIFGKGILVSRSVTYFRLRTVPAFLASFKLV